MLLKLLLCLHMPLYLCFSFLFLGTSHFLPSNLLPLVRMLRSTYKCESWMRPNLETIPLYCRWEKYAAPIDVGISHEVKCRNTLPTDAGVCLSINSMSFFNFYLSRLIFFQLLLMNSSPFFKRLLMLGVHSSIPFSQRCKLYWQTVSGQKL